MENFDVYKDISLRTEGDIYIGVVGPVRTGKSTFITKICENLIIPNIEDVNVKNRVVDELPQSAVGRTIMTTQPKFVPNKAIGINIDDKASFSVRLIDCVGYFVDGALGHMDGDESRMVKTPWSDEEMPFEEAAEIGTRKVIREHSTVGIIMTTDGTVADIPRANYIAAEEKAVREMQEYGKPFVIIINSADEESEYAKTLLKQLREKYTAQVFLMNVMKFTKKDMTDLLSGLLYEFPIKQINVNLPNWFSVLDSSHYLRKDILERVSQAADELKLMRDFNKLKIHFDDCEYTSKVENSDISLGTGEMNITLGLKEELFYKILGEECGEEIRDDSHLLSMLKDMVTAKREYDKLKDAVKSANENGYGIVMPSDDEFILEAPELTENSGGNAVKLKSTAPSLHILKVDVESSVSPMIGDEKQTTELMKHLSMQYEENPYSLWDTDIFGKSLLTVTREGLIEKLGSIQTDTKDKLCETLYRITNEGDGGVLCVLI